MLRERKDDPSPPGLRQVQVGHHPRPLVLVRLLRAHVKRFGTTLDGRIFQTARGSILQDSGKQRGRDQAR